MGLAPDAALALRQLEGAELVQRRLEMDRLRARLNNPKDESTKLREACQGFEAIFVQKIWEQMRKNARLGNTWMHSREEEMYQAMYDQEFARKMAEAGGIGLADMLYEQLSRRLGESGRSARPDLDPSLPVLNSSSSPSALNPRIKELYPERTPLPLEQALPSLKPLDGRRSASPALNLQERH